MLTQLARARVPLGFVCAAAAFALARPTWPAWWTGLAIAVPGALLRLWAAGHIEKGREVTRSGPYRFVRHPLYLGSILLGIGFAIASRSAVVVLLTAAYLGITLMAAIRTEEAALDERFAGAYSAYRQGRAAPVSRAFSWSRARGNREYRALLGLTAAFTFLVVRLLMIRG